MEQIQKITSATLLRFFDIVGKVLAFVAIGVVAPNLHAEINYQQKAEELLPVDCLLPGVVRKLGGQLTYVTQRRPIKTTATDCEIRGGEYVHYDRASYETAFGVWKPLAEGGDARAQNFVGEIYEKGLGIEPDYKQAAHWYELAAEQDYRAAQINLGQLYERGLGVERDIEKALSWYRQSADIKGKILKFVSFDYSDEKIAAMQQAITDNKTQSKRQEQRIVELVAQLDKAVSERGKLESILEEERINIQVERDLLAGQKALLAQNEVKIATLQKELDEQLALEKKELAAKKEALNKQQQLLNQSEQAGEADKAKIAELEQQLAAYQEKARQLNARLTQADKEKNTELAANQQKISTLERELVAKKAALALSQVKTGVTNTIPKKISVPKIVFQFDRQKVADLKKELKTYQAKSKRLTEQLNANQSVLVKKESDLSEKNSQLKSLGNQYASLQKELLDSRKALSEKAEIAVNPPAEQASKAPPRIEVIEPVLLATRGNFVAKTRSGLDQRTIIGQVTSHNKIMEVLINEVETVIDEKGFFQQRVPLEDASTDVTIVAIDKLGLRSDLNFTLEKESLVAQNLLANSSGADGISSRARPIPDINFGKYYALVIGNSDYNEPLPDLNTTQADAKAMSKLLAEKYGFTVNTLINATRYDMLSALNALRGKLTEDDNLLIYYAGHGELDKVNNRGHWLPVDAEETSSANWISNIAITDLLNAMTARKILVISDSCYSGAMTRSTLARLDAGRSDKAWLNWVKLIAGKKSRLSFSSGGMAPVLDGGGGRHSVFAKALMDALESNESVIEGRELHASVAKSVSYAAAAAQFEQTPMYAPIRFAGHEAGDFLFVPKTK